MGFTSSEQKINMGSILTEPTFSWKEVENIQINKYKYAIVVSTLRESVVCSAGDLSLLGGDMEVEV